MNRRRLTMMVSAIAMFPWLSGCAGQGIPIGVNLPPELTGLITNANNIYKKLSGLALPAGASGLLSQMGRVVSQITGSKTVQAARDLVSSFSSLYAAIKPFLPAGGTAVNTATSTTTVGKIVQAIETVLPIMLKVAGLIAMFAREQPTGMTEAEAEALLAS